MATCFFVRHVTKMSTNWWDEPKCRTTSTQLENLSRRSMSSVGDLVSNRRRMIRLIADWTHARHLYAVFNYILQEAVFEVVFGMVLRDSVADKAVQFDSFRLNRCRAIRLQAIWDFKFDGFSRYLPRLKRRPMQMTV